MPCYRCFFVLLLIWALGARIAAVGAEPIVHLEPVRAECLATEVLVKMPSAEERAYTAFPALLDRGDEILVSYKRGRSHAHDPGATLDWFRLNPQTGQVGSTATLAGVPGLIMQMGEWVQFPQGEVVVFIDAQVGTAATERTGLHRVRSRDGGRTFSAPEKVGLMDGVEYGYAFDSVTRGNRTYLLVMTFSNLPGGKSVYPPRPHAGAVAVVSTDDAGQTWRCERNLTEEFGGLPLNESAFVEYGEGFLVTTRGYDSRQRLHLTNDALGLIRQSDLTATHDFIRSHVGRPRLWVRDGQIYLLGRNVSRPGAPMELSLFRIDGASQRVTRWVVLDNHDGQPVFDGYYAQPYFRGAGADTRMQVVTYRGIRGERQPKLLRLEFRWDDVK